MTVRERLSSAQIAIMRSLFQRGASVRPVSLDHQWQRKPAAALSRRGLVEIWYRQAIGEQPAWRGPFCALTLVGAQLAEKFLNPAPRGLSGAEQPR